MRCLTGRSRNWQLSVRGIIRTSVESFVLYDVIFVGYPIWYGNMATPMQTFLHEQATKLAGKRIVLFATSGSSGISSSVSEAQALCTSANHNLAQIKRAEEILSKESVHLSAVQNHYSLLYRSSEKAGILDYCKENGIDFWAYMVLEQGALSGKYDTAHPLPEGSQRGDTYNPLLPQIEKRVAVMRAVGNRYGITPAQVALAWAIA